MRSKVAIIVGSDSDLPTMEKAAKTLDELNIFYSKHIYSAHRTPDELSAFIKEEINLSSAYKVIIAGAGMSAALAGVIASYTIKPVIAVPLSGGKYNGVEAMLSTSEMPPGVPVLNVGIDAAKNAALAAASIIALSDDAVAESLQNYRLKQKQAVMAKNFELHKNDLDFD